MHFHGWKLVSKQVCIICVPKRQADAIQFTVEQKVSDETVRGLAERADEVNNMEGIVCSLDSIDECLSCGS